MSVDQASSVSRTVDDTHWRVRPTITSPTSSSSSLSPSPASPSSSSSAASKLLRLTEGRCSFSLEIDSTACLPGSSMYVRVTDGVSSRVMGNFQRQGSALTLPNTELQVQLMAPDVQPIFCFALATAMRTVVQVVDRFGSHVRVRNLPLQVHALENRSHLLPSPLMLVEPPRTDHNGRAVVLSRLSGKLKDFQKSLRSRRSIQLAIAISPMHPIAVTLDISFASQPKHLPRGVKPPQPDDPNLTDSVTCVHLATKSRRNGSSLEGDATSSSSDDDEQPPQKRQRLDHSDPPSFPPHFPPPPPPQPSAFSAI